MPSERVVSFRDALAFAIGGGWGQETPSTKESHRVRVIRGTDMPGILSLELRDVPVRYEAASKVEKRRLRHGDIVLEISGGSSAKGQPTGRTVFIDDRVLAALGDTVIPASFCRLVRVNPEVICARFAYYWLQDMYVSGRAFAYESQSTGISNFQFERFLDAEQLYLPSMAEQEAIAGTLAAIDDRRVLLRQTNATLEAIAQALFKSWFIDFDPVRAKAERREPEGMDAATAALFPAEFEGSPLGLIPKGWNLEELGQICRLEWGNTTITKKSYVDRGVPAFSAAGQDGLVEVAERHGIGSVISAIGTVGVVHLAHGDWTAIKNTLTAQCSTDDESAWLHSLLRTVKFPTRGSTQQFISLSDARSVKVVAATTELRRRFGEVAAVLISRIATQERQATALSEIRDTLLPRLISGKLRLPEARAQVEESLA